MCFHYGLAVQCICSIAIDAFVLDFTPSIVHFSTFITVVVVSIGVSHMCDNGTVKKKTMVPAYL